MDENRNRHRTVAIVVFDGFDELDALGPYEVLQNASDVGARISVRLCTLEPTDEVRASHGLRIVPDTTLQETEPDIVVVPGGGWNSQSDEGAYTEARRGYIPDAVARLHEDGVTVASVCTGAMLLAEAGLTDGRPAVTHGAAIEDPRKSGADVVEARVVDDGDIVTAGGVTSGIDLALWLVERVWSREIAEEVARRMEYERTEDIQR
jgi:transcriptional regulator GlxA family with amidase domain